MWTVMASAITLAACASILIRMGMAFVMSAVQITETTLSGMEQLLWTQTETASVITAVFITDAAWPELVSAEILLMQTVMGSVIIMWTAKAEKMDGVTAPKVDAETVLGADAADYKRNHHAEQAGNHQIHRTVFGYRSAALHGTFEE